MGGANVLGGVYTCVSHLGSHTKCVFPPLILSLEAKARGSRGHRVVHGREVGEVEVDLVRLGARGRGMPWLARSWLARPCLTTPITVLWGIPVT